MQALNSLDDGTERGPEPPREDRRVLPPPAATTRACQCRQAGATAQSKTKASALRFAGPPLQRREAIVIRGARLVLLADRGRPLSFADPRQVANGNLQT